MNVALILKSQTNGMKLDIYDNNLAHLESETFPDLSTLNFHLQTIAKKHEISKVLMVIHDTDVNRVTLALAEGDDAFFVD